MFLYIETIHANGCLLQSKGRTRKMGKQPRDAENTTRAFFKEYMVNRNVEATLDWLMDDVQWIGTGKGEYSLKHWNRSFHWTRTPTSLYGRI
jgi:hypothetical protein